MKKFSLVLLACLCVLMGFPFSAAAHPADMYYHTHLVRLNSAGLELVWELVPGPMIAQSIWFAADKDQNDRVSSSEAENWALTILGAISGELDQMPLDLILEGVDWPENIEDLYQGEAPIRIYLAAAWPADQTGNRALALHNRFNPKSSLSWFEVIAEDGLGFSLPAQNSGTLALTFGAAAGVAGQDFLSAWESGSPEIPWVVESVGLGELAGEAAAEGQSSPAEGSGPASILEGLIKSQEGSVPFLLASLALAALLGALHALSPGHGKTIVAAYLVGSQGKAYHAVALGAIVTLTHTGSVFALGLITLTASRYFLAVDIFPVLELVSGLLILLLGAVLLWPRLRILFRDLRGRARIKGKAPGSSNEGERRLMIKQPIQEIGPPHSHDPSRMGAIPRQIPAENPLENIRWGSLIPLAISGGLVPCPDAIAILLVAGTINRMGYGLSLILAFSLGLALVLIAVGMLIVQGRRLFDRLRWFNRAALVMPVLSALIVLGAGIFLFVGAFENIRTGTEISGWRIGQPVEDEFDLPEIFVVYTVLDENQRAQLVRQPASGGDPAAITEGSNIWFFAVAPDHSRVVFATDDGANGTQIWIWDRRSDQLELIHECPNAYCSEFAWSPDARGLLYSRLDFDPELNPASVQTIWWLDLDSRESEPLFQDAYTPGFSPRWSPDGKWLSYTSINPLEIRIYKMDSGESQILPSSLGYPAAWSPDSSQVILQDLYWGEFGHLNKLYSYDLENERLVLLAGGEKFDESFPAWSPDGGRLAVVRRAWQGGTPEPDNQVWIMGLDGTESRQLTKSVNTTYGQPAWSSDSRFLVCDYRLVTEGEFISGVIILDTVSGAIRDLPGAGSRPAWLE